MIKFQCKIPVSVGPINPKLYIRLEIAWLFLSYLGKIAQAHFSKYPHLRYGRFEKRQNRSEGQNHAITSTITIMIA